MGLPTRSMACVAAAQLGAPPQHSWGGKIGGSDGMVAGTLEGAGDEDQMGAGAAGTDMDTQFFRAGVGPLALGKQVRQFFFAGASAECHGCLPFAGF